MQMLWSFFRSRRELRETIAGLMAENDLLRAELAEVRKADKCQRMLISVLRDCNRELDERLQAKEAE
jgi:hypothetical protein